MVAGTLKVLLIYGAVFGLVPIAVLAERRIAGFIQNRLGPNRVGPQGLLQPVADVIKLLFKEEIVPAGADRLLYLLGPFLVFAPAAFAFAVMPVGRGIQIADLGVGVLFAVAVSSFSVYGIVLGGWASNNKWSLIGGLRSSAQIVSYEVAIGLALVSVLMTTGTVHMQGIVEEQVDNGWLLLRQPLAFLIFLVAAFAETNRLPFDLPECEAELVAGYHTEYSSMKFALFFLGEYIALITASALIATLFLGGWDPVVSPGLLGPPGQAAFWGDLVSVAAFSGKVVVLVFFFIWVRWTLPRFRYDQLMALGWKVLVPLGLANIFLSAILGAFET